MNGGVEGKRCCGRAEGLIKQRWRKVVQNIIPTVVLQYYGSKFNKRRAAIRYPSIFEEEEFEEDGGVPLVCVSMNYV